MYDTLIRLFESENFNRRVILRTQLKNVKMDTSENVQVYLTKFSQIREQFPALGDMVEEAEAVFTILNGLPTSWNFLILEVCSRRNHSPQRFQKGQKKDYSTYTCYKCQVRGHIARNCPQQDPKKKSKRKFHALVAEEEVPSNIAKEEPSEEDYVLSSALTSSVSP